MAYFPDVGGFVLAGRRVRLPRDLPAGLTIVAFQMWHQRLVDEWIAWCQNAHPEVPVVEVPVISRAFRWQRPFIDGGMIAGIRDRTVLARTITVYTDVDALCEALDLPDTSTVAALVLDHGQVQACVRGPLDDVGAATVLSPALRALDGHAT